MIRHYECENCAFVGSYSQKRGKQDQFEDLLRTVNWLKSEVENAQLRETRVKNDYDAVRQELETAFGQPKQQQPQPGCREPILIGNSTCLMAALDLKNGRAKFIRRKGWSRGRRIIATDLIYDLTIDDMAASDWEIWA